MVVFPPMVGIKLNERIQLEEATWPKNLPGTRVYLLSGVK